MGKSWDVTGDVVRATQVMYQAVKTWVSPRQPWVLAGIQSSEKPHQGPARKENGTVQWDLTDQVKSFHSFHTPEDLSSLETQILRCNKKKIPGLCLVPGTELLNPLASPKQYLLYANKMTDSRLSDGGWIPEIASHDQRVGIFSPGPSPPLGKGEVPKTGLTRQWPMN